VIDDVANKKQMVVDTYIVAGIGKRTETYPFIAASTGRFTQEELDDYKQLLQERGLSFPKQAALDAKLDELRALLKYTLTNDEITEMVQRKAFLRNKYDPNVRAQLERSIEEAKASDNAIYAKQLEKELESLGQASSLAFKTALKGFGGDGGSPAGGGGGSKKGMSQQDRLAQLNAENRRRNVEAVRRAELQHRHRQREAEQRLARGGDAAAEGDPLSRRPRTRAKFAHGRGEGADSGTGSSSQEPPAAGGGPSRMLLPEVRMLQERKIREGKGVPGVQRPFEDEDVVGSLEWDFEAEV
jgi:RNA polymerase-associated protein RTF1